MKLRPAELLVPLAVAGFGLIYLVSIQGLPRESMVFPIAVLIALAVTGVLALLREFTDVAHEVDRRPLFASGELVKPMVVFVGAIGYLILFKYAGFVIAALVFMPAVMIALGTRVPIALGVALGVVGGLYLLFAKLFYVDL